MQIKKLLPTLIITALGVLSSGCVGISIGNRGEKTPPPAPVIVVSEPGDAATLAEIDAAAGLSFDNSRTDALKAIARRPKLSPAAQVHLANAALKRLNFDDSRVAVLLALIGNPSFCEPARHAIVSQLNRVSFDSNRQAILRAVNEREMAKQTPPRPR